MRCRSCSPGDHGRRSGHPDAETRRVSTPHVLKARALPLPPRALIDRSSPRSPPRNHAPAGRQKQEGGWTALESRKTHQSPRTISNAQVVDRRSDPKCRLLLSRSHHNTSRAVPNRRRLPFARASRPIPSYQASENPCRVSCHQAAVRFARRPLPGSQRRSLPSAPRSNSSSRQPHKVPTGLITGQPGKVGLMMMQGFTTGGNMQNPPGGIHGGMRGVLGPRRGPRGRPLPGAFPSGPGRPWSFHSW
jgi:hypothetical protein